MAAEPSSLHYRAFLLTARGYSLRMRWWLLDRDAMARFDAWRSRLRSARV